MRWVSDLSKFYFEIGHRLAKMYRNAEVLSRLSRSEEDTSLSKIFNENIRLPYEIQTVSASMKIFTTMIREIRITTLTTIFPDIEHTELGGLQDKDELV